MTTKIAGLFMVSVLALSGAASTASALSLSGNVSSAPVSSSMLMGAVCAPITHYLVVGSRDGATSGDVTTLQDYLYAHGYLSVQATGYFGPLTMSAVEKFQAANGVSAVGSVGPLTRALFSRVGCGSGSTTTGSMNPSSAVEISSVTPTSGLVGTQITITGSGFTGDSNIVHFGGGGVGNVASNGSQISFTVPSSMGPYCAPGTACPMYEMLVTPNTYNITVSNENGTSNTISFTVTGTAPITPANPITPTGYYQTISVPGSATLSQNGSVLVQNAGTTLGYITLEGTTQLGNGTYQANLSVSPGAPSAACLQPGAICNMPMALALTVAQGASITADGMTISGNTVTAAGATLSFSLGQ